MYTTPHYHNFDLSNLLNVAHFSPKIILQRKIDLRPYFSYCHQFFNFPENSDGLPCILNNFQHFSEYCTQFYRFFFNFNIILDDFLDVFQTTL